MISKTVFENMNSSTYAWKAGGRSPVPAQIAGEALIAIQEANGDFFTPASVVFAARPKNAPLHPAFEWNDKKAAAAHREDQARYLIRNIVMVNPEKPKNTAVRAFVSISHTSAEDDICAKRYTSTIHAMTDKDLREQVLAQAQSDWRAFARKYAQFLDLAEMAAAFDTANIRAQKAQSVLQDQQDATV